MCFYDIPLGKGLTLDDAIESVVKLADRFEVDWLLEDSEEFLRYRSHFTVVEKLVLSTKVNLDELQVRRFSVHTSVGHCKHCGG